MMNKRNYTLAILLSSVIWYMPLLACCQILEAEKVLIFTKAMDFRHESTEASIVAICDLCEQHGIKADATEDSGWFRPEKLKEYAAIIFLNSSGDVFNENQEAAFRGYIQSGGGFVGIHGASSTEYGWDWFGKLIGGYFAGHPEPQEATLIVQDTTHISTKNLPKTWQHFEEWYNFRWVDEDFNVLISVDDSTYRGSKHPGNHPISWYKSFEGGRMFYTALGHTTECYSDEHFLNHVLGGILYAMGKSANE